MEVNKENILHPWSGNKATIFEGEAGYFGNSFSELLASTIKGDLGKMKINRNELYTNILEEDVNEYEYFFPNPVTLSELSKERNKNWVEKENPSEMPAHYLLIEKDCDIFSEEKEVFFGVFETPEEAVKKLKEITSEIFITASEVEDRFLIKKVFVSEEEIKFNCFDTVEIEIEK